MSAINEATFQEWNKVRDLMTEDQYLNPGTSSERNERLNQFDMVQRPHHYNKGAIECIDAIRESMEPNEFRGYLKGSTLKYLWRYEYKGKPVEDLRKARWFLERLIDEVCKVP